MADDIELPEGLNPAQFVKDYLLKIRNISVLIQMFFADWYLRVKIEKGLEALLNAKMKF